MAANDASPVVSGQVIQDGGKGAHYKLANYEFWSLGRDDCRSLPDGYPRWDLPS